jgi:hypothetical protein
LIRGWPRAEKKGSNAEGAKFAEDWEAPRPLRLLSVLREKLAAPDGAPFIRRLETRQIRSSLPWPRSPKSTVNFPF